MLITMMLRQKFELAKASRYELPIEKRTRGSMSSSHVQCNNLGEIGIRVTSLVYVGYIAMMGVQYFSVVDYCKEYNVGYSRLL